MRVPILFLIIIVNCGCNNPKAISKAEKFEINLTENKKLEIIYGEYVFKNTEANRLNNEGIDALKEEDYDNAETKFIAAIRLEPDNPAILNNLGNIYREKGTHRMAMEYYKESFIFSDSTYFPSAFNMGVIRNLMGEYDKSFEIFEYILSRTKSENERTTVMYEMAHVMIKQNKCSEAINLYDSIKTDLYKFSEYKEDIAKFEKKIKNCTE